MIIAQLSTPITLNIGSEHASHKTHAGIHDIEQVPLCSFLSCQTLCSVPVNHKIQKQADKQRWVVTQWYPGVEAWGNI